MTEHNHKLPTLSIALGLALAAWSLNTSAATAASSAAPKASAPHDLRTQHLRLRTKCEAQAKSLGLQGEALKVELQRCLLQGG
jgi:hypothetical protein